MKTVRKHLFTWKEASSGVLLPMCPRHPDAEVYVQDADGGRDKVVSCALCGGQPLNMCSNEEFEAERSEVMDIIRRYEEDKE